MRPTLQWWRLPLLFLWSVCAGAVAPAAAQLSALNDPKVSIPLPPALEQAVAQAKPVFEGALRHMTLNDAKAILSGGDDAGTQYFRNATSAQLTTKFRPIVAGATAKLKLASQYDELAGKAAQFGLISAADANLDDYVTAKALDGLFSRIGDEERAIRKDPLGQANSLIKRVFGAL